MIETYSKEEREAYNAFLRDRAYGTPQVFFQKGYVLLWLGEGLTRRMHPLEASLVGKFLMEAAENARHIL